MAELNGQPVRVREMQALALVNYGHFTTMRVEDRRVRGLGLHLERLREDCRVLFGAALDTGRVRELARRAVPASGAVTVRVTVFDPGLDLGRPVAAGDPHVLVTSRPAGGSAPPPLRVRSVAYARDLPRVKGVGLFGGLYQRRQAQAAGFDDALFTDRGQAVTEGATWNIGFFDGSRVVWPDGECLDGVTMRLLKQVHPYGSATVRLGGVAGMEAAFATNAAVGVRAVSLVDGAALASSHPVVDRLRRAYEDIPGEVL
ncbi:aminotransferase [Streptomyces globosus]|uniref:Aminotransferase n=1 Tax=Streptomyces globosus TaxID=68209 RepID=A0A344TUF7_9ACTN|nr:MULTISPECIES: aminotransferase class IV family protein [Streptomyces]AXE22278.1 aminotransferase [Streptomyces globosus]